MSVACLVLAAGQSTRMGEVNKLLLPVQGTPLIRRTLLEIKKDRAFKPIVVVGHESSVIKKAIDDLDIQIVENHDYRLGMHTSIRAGLLAAASNCEALIICQADQPFFSIQVLQSLFDSYLKQNKTKIIVPTFQGRRGNPVLIPQQYFAEIVSEPDGDYGCAYLLKRHPQNVEILPVTTPAILVDVDQPEDYLEATTRLDDLKDPIHALYQKTVELRQQGHAFSVATIIDVKGSASARVGSKAIFDQDGRNILGWVGGGCAERFIGEESCQAINARTPRTVLADLDDEIFGLGVACGGTMSVFIDPVVPADLVKIPFAPYLMEELKTLAGDYGWSVQIDPTQPMMLTADDLILGLARAAASARRRRATPLTLFQNPAQPVIGPSAQQVKKIKIVGRTRITEALARHFHLLGFDVSVTGPDLKPEHYPSAIQCACFNDSYDEVSFQSNQLAIIASHTSHDPELVRRAILAEVPYIAMVGSPKRASEVQNYLQFHHLNTAVPIFLPAGLDLDARNPDEIALSIAAEVVLLQQVARADQTAPSTEVVLGETL